MRLASFLAALALAACDSLAVNGPDLVPVAAEVRTAPATATLDARPLRLEVYAWRDFMPIAPQDGQPLIVSARVVATDGGALPAELVATDVWTVRGDRAWRAGTDEQRREPDGRSLEVVAREGPKWGPGERVDVVVALRVPGGGRVLLRAAGVEIARTD